MSKGCFSEVLRTVKRKNGKMLIVSNAAVCNSGGLYSRLWCTWEVYCAVRDNVLLVMHPRTRTEKHLYGERGERLFDAKEARCGNPREPQRSDDEIRIRRVIDAAALRRWCLPCIATSVDWEGIQAAVKGSTRGFLRDTLVTGELDASSSGLDDCGVELLLEAMKEDPWPCTKFTLRSSNIGDRAAEALAEALKTNKTLERLLLQVNNIGDDGAKALAEALKSNDTLTRLSLGMNRIGRDGAKALAEALKSNDRLTMLYLSNNLIGSAGAKALAEALKTNKTLTHLFLNVNYIGDDGSEALAEALKSNNTLKVLDLNGSEEAFLHHRLRGADVISDSRGGSA
eukprot:NODE_1234_length_1201_cov_315.315009.p1 GENE.NODE_1234_length_1201_cov_315.315009~~NODE_1234_length_1201_cov_315.315009.p1  ORF type:complete len:383 (+),score=118.59 NODE_1234_length_1201_cov_315.315009:124-1149(+)